MINNTDLEKLYNRIDPHIKVISAFYEYDNLYKIIKTCRLKPYCIFTDNFTDRTKYEKHWVDEFGNSILFEKTGIEIIYNDLNLVENTKINTDLFSKRYIKYFIENGKILILINNVVCIYGIDEYIRTFYFENGEIERIPPLMLGIDCLKNIFENINVFGKKSINFDGSDFFGKIDRFDIYNLPLKEKVEMFEGVI
jgi:hypothetical protein